MLDDVYIYTMMSSYLHDFSSWTTQCVVPTVQPLCENEIIYIKFVDIIEWTPWPAGCLAL